MLRNPNFIELDNITELSLHEVNTKRVSTGDKGMLHREGGTHKYIQAGRRPSTRLSRSNMRGS